MSAFCLSRHAGYRCHHSGACCTSNWPVQIETERLGPVRAALEDGRLAPSEGDVDAFQVLPDLPAGVGAILRTTAAGACIFHDGGARRCRIHRDLGQALLPSACQHFPRRCLLERDKVYVSLSHYCPTVARLPFAENAARGIVPAPDSLAGPLHLEGLDASEALPPLLRPGMLTDLEAFHRWERAAVEFLEAGAAPETALARIREMTRQAAGWDPGSRPLETAVEEAAERCSAVADRADSGVANEEQLVGASEVVRMAIPDCLRPRAPRRGTGASDARFVAPAWPGFSGPIGRFLAAHAFGSWCAYFGAGLTTIVRSLEVALAVVRVEAGRLCDERAQALDQPILVEAFRAADLQLAHLADPRALALALDRCGESRPATAEPGRRPA